jgi:hypothetical protein
LAPLEVADNGDFMSMKRFPGVALLAAALLVLSGCNSDRLKTAVVRGKVTCNGKPVPNGTISFVPASGPAATGEIQPDGSFTLTTYRNGDGAVLGQHTVVIVAMEDMSTRLATTDLRREVKDGENSFNFDLVDEKKKGR